MKKRNIIILVILLAIGFASVSTTLILNGVVGIGSSEDEFDVIFTDAEINGEESVVTINETKKKITFSSSKLTTVGEKAILDYKIKNNSTQYDANVTINCTSDETEFIKVTNELEGEEIIEDYETTFIAQEEKSGVITAELIKSAVDESDSIELTCTIVASATERDSAVEDTIPDPVSFADDSWATIKKTVESGDYPYQVGDTKCVSLTGLTTTNDNQCSEGAFKLRVANTSECTTETSETACGFVLEFVDIVDRYVFNLTETNVGGWPASTMRAYVNSNIYNALPSDLKDAIITTKVLSGHGSTAGETNFTSMDKLYLLSAKEIWGDDFNQGADETLSSETRQLDYYANEGVTYWQTSAVAKKRNGTAANWALRSVDPTNATSYYRVNTAGNNSYTSATSTSGISPAFRIA